MSANQSLFNELMSCQVNTVNSLINVAKHQLKTAASVRSANDLSAFYGNQLRAAGALQGIMMNYALTMGQLSLGVQQSLLRQGTRGATRAAQRVTDSTAAATAAVKDVTASAAKTAAENADEYDTVTKEALYEIAKETDIEGRSSMNKQQLQKAIADADIELLAELSREELYQKAQLLDVEGRSKMSRDQLLDAIYKALGR